MSTYVAIGSVTLSSAQPSVTFLGIPQTYTDLIIRSNFTCDTNATILQMTFNSDSSSSYSRVQIWGNGSATGDLVQADQTSFAAGYWQTGSGNQIQSIVNLMSYSNSSLYKSWLTRWNQVAGIDNSATMSTGMWRNTNAITSIKLTASTGNFNAGSTFDIYGVNAANSGQAKATGGDTIVRDASYWYHVFNKSGTFTPAQNLTNVEYLVVAGGGGGGSHTYYGGGGAGGYRSNTGQSFSSGTAYSITVGAGGALNNKGNNSSISGTGMSTFSSTGGGLGGNATVAGRTVLFSGGNGGSGGGAGNRRDNNNSQASPAVEGFGNEGSYTPVEGYNGGTGYAGNGNAAGAGGGGAGGAGEGGFGDNRAGGYGGIGSNAHSTWATATSTGVSGYYAGGGGGGAEGGTYAGGAGGSGGGGRGYGNTGAGLSGTANTGGGGGARNGLGGSGIIIVRYPV